MKRDKLLQKKPQVIILGVAVVVVVDGPADDFGHSQSCCKGVAGVEHQEVLSV